MIKLTRPADLQRGDELVGTEFNVYVLEKYIDDDGVWIEFSDGSEGYLDRPIKVIPVGPATD